MPTVNITGSPTNFFVYATDLEASDYLLGDIARDPVWVALTPDEKKRALISATRYLDRLAWAGVPTLPAQPNAFPRMGIVDAEGNDASGTPQEIIDACCIIAADFVADPTLLDALTTTSLIKELQAGSVKVIYFRSPGGTGYAVPQSVFNLLKPFFGADSGTPPFVSGTDYYAPGELAVLERFGFRGAGRG